MGSFFPAGGDFHRSDLPEESEGRDEFMERRKQIQAPFIFPL